MEGRELMAGELTARTAGSRSREADFATDEAAELSTPEGHRHAAELHREAARWQRRAENLRRAVVHDEHVSVHEQLADRLEDEAANGAAG